MIRQERSGKAIRRGSARGFAAAAGAVLGGLAAWKAPPGVLAAAVESRAAATTAGPAESPKASAPRPAEHCAVPAVASAPQPSPRRVHAKTRFVWIREEPDWGSQWIGYLWTGGSVALASPKPIYARGCDAWYAVEPRGYVCIDGKRATLDAGDPEYSAVRAKQGAYESPAPHRYAESLGTERYEVLPDVQEQRLREPDLPAWEQWLRSPGGGPGSGPFVGGVDLSPAPEDAVAFASLPVDVQVQSNRLRRRSTVAYLGEYRHADRSFLLTADLAWVPKDRVRPYPAVSFRGVRLDGSARLPLAFFREGDRPVYERDPSGRFARSRDSFPRLSWVSLTGREQAAPEGTYLETTSPGRWVLAADAVVPKERAATPWGSPVGVPDTADTRPKGRATWIDVSLYGGWLVAYEGTYPVFATLASPGRGGAPRPGREPIATASTPTGRFTITGKFVTANMTAPDDIVHSDVPWVQNIVGPYAIHAAYWHDSWGERVSGGCVNVSPGDGKWLFSYSEPPLPVDWHGVRWEPQQGPATIVLIHR